jgi:Arc/MetJ family transcription regulator
MRTTIEIDDALMAEAQKASGQTKKQTVEQALRLLVRLRRQSEVGAAFASTVGAVISREAAKAAEPDDGEAARHRQSSALLQRPP